MQTLLPTTFEHEALRWGVSLVMFAIAAVVRYFDGPLWLIGGLGIVGLLLVLRGYWPQLFRMDFWSTDRIAIAWIPIGAIGVGIAFYAAVGYVIPLPLVLSHPWIPTPTILLETYRNNETHHKQGASHSTTGKPSARGPLTKCNIPLSILISSPSDPAITVENASDNVLDGLRWELVMFRTSDQAYFSYVTQSIGYIKPNSMSARYAMQLNSLPRAPGSGQLLDGDKLIGTLSVDCPICKGNTVIVSFVWGSSGWFVEIPEGNGKLLLPNDMSQGGIKQFTDSLNAISKTEERQPII